MMNIVLGVIGAAGPPAAASGAATRRPTQPQPGCPYRKSNPHVLMMQSTKDGLRFDTATGCSRFRLCNCRHPIRTRRAGWYKQLKTWMTVEDAIEGGVRSIYLKRTAARKIILTDAGPVPAQLDRAAVS